MIELPVGCWVRYEGTVKSSLNGRVGQVVSYDYPRGLYYVTFQSRVRGGIYEYGCYPELLTRVGVRVAAVEIACRALGIETRQEAS